MMHSKTHIGILMVLCSLVPACSSHFIRPKNISSAFLPPSKGTSRSPASVGSEYSRHHERRRNSILLKLRDNANPEQLSALNAAYSEFELRHEKALLKKRAGRFRINAQKFQDQEEMVVERLRATGAVDFVEPDFTLPMALTPNDPSYSNQWYHGVIGTPQAWNFSTGNSTVVVALCDSGFDLSHPDLTSRFVLPGYNTVKNNSQIDTLNGHGTMTSGVIGAIGNNGIGVAGMAWNIRLLPIQITDREDGASTYSDVAECISYAADHGAKVINISYDYTYTSAAINEAAAAFRAQGGLVVVAAGNAGTDLSAWGSSPALMVIGATEQNNTLATFSNYGTPLDLVAPGVNIYTTTVGGNYDYASGTSFSTPIVAGAAALLFSAKPTLSADQVEQTLLSTAKDLGARGPDAKYGSGQLDIDVAMRAVAGNGDTIPPQITLTTSPSADPVTGTLLLSAAVSDNVGVASVQFYVDAGMLGAVTKVPFTLNLDTTTLTNGAHSLSAKAVDAAGNSSISTVTVNVMNNVIVKGTAIDLDNLVANAQDATRTFSGKWCNSQKSGSYGTLALLSCGSVADTYRFTPVIPKAQTYKISIRYLAKSTNGKNVPVFIKTNSGIVKKLVNMRVGGSTWLSLGTFSLNQGTSNYVEIRAAAGVASIDGVRFE